jgi:phosphate transport system substrate-binding protein
MRFRSNGLHKQASIALAFALIALITGCRGKSDTMHVNGGGSTFLGPLMKKWSKVYYDTKGVEVDYAPKGSGNGIQQMTAGTYQFGCTDAPMNAGELAKAKENRGEVLHLPLVFGAVVPIYNLPELKEAKEKLRFTGPVLADIFLGNISKWNDPALVKLNPNLSLPDRAIVAVHRAEPSGTTYIFTDYLEKVSDTWRTKVGPGAKEVQWPTGSGKPGSQGVAGHVASTEGAIGYVELDYAQSNHLAFGAMQNKEGHFVVADAPAIAAAAKEASDNVPDDLCMNLNNQAGDKTYPICGAVWAVLYVNQPKEDAGKGLVEFLSWCVHDGQKQASELNYAPLPEALVSKIDEKLKTVKGGNGAK